MNLKTKEIIELAKETITRAKELTNQLGNALEETAKPNYVGGTDLSGYFQDKDGNPKIGESKIVPNKSKATTLKK